MAAIILSDNKLILNIMDVPKGLFPTTEGCYKLDSFDRKNKYVTSDDRKVITIGLHKKSGLIFAAKDNRFYNNPDFKRLASY